MTTKNNEIHHEYDGVGSCPQDLSQEIAKFAIHNGSKDPNKLKAAILFTAHDSIDEDGDECLNISALVGGSPTIMVDLLIDAMETVCENSHPAAVVRIYKALIQFAQKKVAEVSEANQSGSAEEEVVKAFGSLVQALEKIAKK